MPRINIETEIFHDDRFLELVARLGNKKQAIGELVFAWHLSQKFWIKDSLIPVEIWYEQFDDLLIQLRFAEKTANGIYVKGSEKHFLWIKQKVDAGRKGGKISAEIREKKHGFSQPKHRRSEIQAEGHFPEAVLRESPKRTEASLLLTPYSLIQEELHKCNSSSTVVQKIAPPVAAKNDPVIFNNEHELLAAIPQKTMERWSKLYEGEYLQRETIKAFGWYQNNPRKAPKTARGWVSALSSWFDRGWGRYAAQIKSNAVSPADEWIRRKNDTTGV